MVLLQPEKFVERVIYENLSDFLNDAITTENSFMHFELKDKLTGKLFSTNFLLLNKLKNSKQITNPQLQVSLIDLLQFDLIYYQVFHCVFFLLEQTK